MGQLLAILLALLGGLAPSVAPAPSAGSPGIAPPETESQPVPGTGAKRALSVGDSLAVGALPYLKEGLPGWRIEQSASIGRHTSDGVSEIVGRGDSLPPVLVVSLGTNDDPSATATFSGQIEAVLEAAGPGRCVVWANIVRPPYNGVSYAGYNRELASAALSNPNLILIDWRRIVVQHPEYLASDGVHGTSAGYAARGRALAQAVAYCGQGNTF